MALTITTQDIGSSIASGQGGQSIITGTPTTASYQQTVIGGSGVATFQITGTWTGTLAFEGSADGGTTWVATDAALAGTDQGVQSVTSNCVAKVATGGFSHVRVRATAAVTGTATIVILGNTVLDLIHNVQINNNAALVAVNPSVTSNSAYSVGNVVGGIQTITGAVRRPNGTGFLESLSVFDPANQKAQLTVFLFKAAPSGGTYADKGALSLNAADQAKCIGVAAITTGNYTTIGSGAAIATVAGLVTGAGEGLAIQGDSTQAVYAIAVTASTPTYQNVAPTFTYGILQS